MYSTLSKLFILLSLIIAISPTNAATQSLADVPSGEPCKESRASYYQETLDAFFTKPLYIIDQSLKEIKMPIGYLHGVTHIVVELGKLFTDIIFPYYILLTNNPEVLETESYKEQVKRLCDLAELERKRNKGKAKHPNIYQTYLDFLVGYPLGDEFPTKGYLVGGGLFFPIAFDQEIAKLCIGRVPREQWAVCRAMDPNNLIIKLTDIRENEVPLEIGSWELHWLGTSFYCSSRSLMRSIIQSILTPPLLCMRDIDCQVRYCNSIIQKFLDGLPPQAFQNGALYIIPVRELVLRLNGKKKEEELRKIPPSDHARLSELMLKNVMNRKMLLAPDPMTAATLLVICGFWSHNTPSTVKSYLQNGIYSVNGKPYHYAGGAIAAELVRTQDILRVLREETEIDLTGLRVIEFGLPDITAFMARP